MGLGKTIQAIAIMIHYNPWPCLIVCPSSLRMQWRSEILTWCTHTIKKEDVMVIERTNQVFLKNSKIDIVSYTMSASKINEIKKRKYKMVICDESHYIKNRKSIRARKLVPFLKRIRYLILLSGTPLLNRPQELYTQITSFNKSHILTDSLTKKNIALHSLRVFHRFYDFAIRYCNGHMGRFGFDANGASNSMELHNLLKEHLMVRRTKAEVLPQLPKKIRQRVYVDITKGYEKKVEKQFEELKTIWNEMDENGLNLREKIKKMYEHQHQIMDLYRLSSRAKIKSCVEYLQLIFDSKLKSNEKLIIFAHHRYILDVIEDCIEKFMKENVDRYGKALYGYIRIDGSIPSSRRHILLQAFQNRKECLIALLSIRACNVGLNMVASHHIVFVEMDWNPGNNLQAEDRIHRIGQTQICHIQYLLSPSTFDDRLWRMNNFQMIIS